MTKKERAEIVYEELKKLYPETSCFLKYKKDYELLFAIILSAQSTDIKVNEATSLLLKEYDSLEKFASASPSSIIPYIKQVGLANSKSNYLVKTSQILLFSYSGKVPKDRKILVSLPGVGEKTAAVFLAEYYNYPFIPVDTHVKRVSNRLSLVKEDDHIKIETDLEYLYRDKADLISIHRRLILFGRDVCHAIRPNCLNCPFTFCKNKIVG